MKKSPELPAPEPALVLHDQLAGVPELDLPNAPDFVSRRTPMTLEKLLPLMEERRRLFPRTAAMAEARRRRRVYKEFVL